MALFRYWALNTNGKQIKGTIDADSLLEAKQKLIRREILVTDVAPFSDARAGRGLKKRDILSFTRESARLLRAGLPLYEALSALEEKYRSHPIHEVLLDLCDRIRSGQPFSQALFAHSHHFDILYCSMIANSEKVGSLPKALEELTQLIERQLLVQKQFLAALLYPALLGCFCLAVLSTLLFFVVPSLFELFEGKNLHPFTQFVFACSRFAVKAKWGLGFGVILFAAAAVSAFFSSRARAYVRQTLAQVPWLKDLLAKVAFVRFFRAAATLLEGGLPAVAALEQAATVLHHPPLEKVWADAKEKLSQGESLQNSLQGQPFIPPLVTRMLGIAQEGGNLPAMMKQISAIYEEELEKTFSQIAALAQPILLLVLGLMVGFVLLSVLLPLTDVSTFAT